PICSRSSGLNLDAITTPTKKTEGCCNHRLSPPLERKLSKISTLGAPQSRAETGIWPGSLCFRHGAGG
ncbi:hypothetical protein ACGFIE_26445, partial [Micromonospora sp. NPDC049275]|uniref:hypothetical protein n=1 Tax=Micromonospora sp. NPDC049275 TaxID=3364268 RepID=UPI00371ABC47